MNVWFWEAATSLRTADFGSSRREADFPLRAAEALTVREREVLHLICAGYSNEEIAELLALAEGTVKNHVSNLLLKLNTRDKRRGSAQGLAGRPFGASAWKRTNLPSAKWPLPPSIYGRRIGALSA